MLNYIQRIERMGSGTKKYYSFEQWVISLSLTLPKQVQLDLVTFRACYESISMNVSLKGPYPSLFLFSWGLWGSPRWTFNFWFNTELSYESFSVLYQA